MADKYKNIKYTKGCFKMGEGKDQAINIHHKVNNRDILINIYKKELFSTLMEIYIKDNY